MIDKAILYLKERGIDAVEESGILVVPCSSPEDIYPLANNLRRYFKEIGYNKSWSIDPYFYQKRGSIDYEMFNMKGDNYEHNKE